MASLNLHVEYYNALDIEGFTAMMRSPTFSYKFYWLEAYVTLVDRNQTEVTYNDMINEMILHAWYSVLEYHIHLSGMLGGEVKDSLEKAVLKLSALTGLSSSADPEEIRNAIAMHDSELYKEKVQLTKYVPTRALSGFANKGDRKVDLNNTNALMEYYNHINETSFPLPYTFGEGTGLNRKLIINPIWIKMIQDNTVNILGWIQLEKAKWLQMNNPEVPGIVYKLTNDDMSERKLSHVRNLWEYVLKKREVIDIFKDEPVSKEYDVDHFIPRSFVMNDELWNLMPIDSSLNASKNNRLPEWEPFFERFADNQYKMYQLLGTDDKMQNLYHACYKDNLHSLWAEELYRKGNSQEEFFTVLDKNMRPVYDSAHRQGYTIWNR